MFMRWLAQGYFCSRGSDCSQKIVGDWNKNKNTLFKCWYDFSKGGADKEAAENFFGHL